MNSKRLRPIAAGVAAAIGTMTFHPAVAQVTGQPTSPGETCQTAPLENWTPQEKWVWRKVCVGEIADFNEEPGYSSDLDPNEPQGWPESRILTPEFLETILLDEPFRSAQTRRGVRIVGAWFKGPIDLRGAEIERELWLHRSRLDNGGVLVAVRIGVLSLEGSVVDGQLKMERAEIGSLYLRGGAKFREVHLVGAKIGHQLSMTGSTFDGTLDMNGATVEGDLSMEGAKFLDVVLDGAKIGKHIVMDGSTFARGLCMNSVTVDGNLYMRKDSKCKAAEFQEVDLRAAKIAGQLDMYGSTFSGTLDMRSATVGGPLYLDGADLTKALLDGESLSVGGNLDLYTAKLSEINLHGAKIAGQLDMHDSRFAGTLDMRRATVGGDLLLHGADLTEAPLLGEWLSVGENLDLSTANVSGIDLHGAKIAGQLDMQESTFAGTLDMSSATVGGDLLLREAVLNEAPLLGGWLSVGGNLDLRSATVSGINLRGTSVVGELWLFVAVWEPGSILDLQHAKVGRLVASVGQSCPASTMLAGFSYDALGSTTSQTDESNPVEAAADFVERWLREEKVHSPQAHEQFAAVLRQMGLPDRARLTLYEGKNHELWEELRGWHLPQAGWLFALWAMIGYGYRVWYALVWIAVLVAVGWRIARKSGRKIPDTGEPLGFWYSLDRLLPIMVLRKHHYEIDLPPRSRVYFYFHMFMGYVLAMFLLAGLSGLVG